MTALTANRLYGHQLNKAHGLPVKGFTLIEVMIVVAIIAILASVALPAYTAYIRRGQLQEAFTNLSDQRIKLEQYYQDNKNYGSNKFCSTNTAAGVSINGSKYFTYTCSTDKNDTGASADGQGYLFTATGTGSTAGYAYTLDDQGNKVTKTFAGTAVTGSSCWSVKSATDC
jgi:type IV pilus assembly protein PilE